MIKHDAMTNNMADITTLPYRCPKCLHTHCFPDIVTLRTHLETDHSYVRFTPPPSRASSSPRVLTSRSSLQQLPLNQTSGYNGGFSQHARELEKQLLLATGLEGVGFESWQSHHAWGVQKGNAGLPEGHGVRHRHHARGAEKELSLTESQGVGFDSEHQQYWPQHSTPKPHLNKLGSPSLYTKSPRDDLDVLQSIPYSSSPREGQDRLMFDGSHDDETRYEMMKLKKELFEKDQSLSETSHTLQEVNLDRHKLQMETRGLTQQVQNHSTEIAHLKSVLEEQNREIKNKEGALTDMREYLETTAVKQSTARESLQKYVDELMVKAEKAEMEALNASGSVTGTNSAAQSNPSSGNEAYATGERTPPSNRMEEAMLPVHPLKQVENTRVSTRSFNPNSSSNQLSNTDFTVQPPNHILTHNLNDVTAQSGNRSPEHNPSPITAQLTNHSPEQILNDITAQSTNRSPEHILNGITAQSTNHSPSHSPVDQVEMLTLQHSTLQQQLEALQLQQVQLQQSLIQLAEQSPVADQLQYHQAQFAANQAMVKSLDGAASWQRDQSRQSREKDLKCTQSLPTQQLDSQMNKTSATDQRSTLTDGRHGLQHDVMQRRHTTNAAGHAHRTLPQPHPNGKQQKPSANSMDPESRNGESQQHQYDQKDLYTDPLDELPHHHQTLSWQRTSSLRTNYFSTSSPKALLSSTLPSYAGSDLPDFESLERLPENSIQRTNMHLEHTHEHEHQNGQQLASLPQNSMHRTRSNTHGQHLENLPPGSMPRAEANTDGRHHDSLLQDSMHRTGSSEHGRHLDGTPQSFMRRTGSNTHDQHPASNANASESAIYSGYPDSQVKSVASVQHSLPPSTSGIQYPAGRLPSPTDMSSTDSNISSSDSMNLELLQDVFQELSDRKQHQETNGSLPSGSSLKLSSLPRRPPHHPVAHLQKDVRSATLPPNGIPKSLTPHEEHIMQTMPNDNRTRLTLPNENGTRLALVNTSQSQNIGRHSSLSQGTVSDLSDDEDDSFTDVTYTPSESSHYGYPNLKGAKIPLPSMPMTRTQKFGLLCIFRFLDLHTLLDCALVCQDWKNLSRHPSLWRTVELANHRISSKFIQTISEWCTELSWLTLDNLRPRKRRPQENRDAYRKDIRGCLEPGLEYMLHRSGSQLISLKIENCTNIFTERCLWLVSCYCRNLCSLTYVSHTDPVGHEVIWALGAGCRKIESLKLPPGYPCDQPHRFDNRCLQMIGRCWPLLQALSVGGQDVDGKALIAIAKSCQRLQVLELDHMSKVTEQVAAAMTRNGLRGLRMLIFRHTPVTTKSIMQFNGSCSQLKSMTVHLSPDDYFRDSDGGEQGNVDQNAERFKQLHHKLQTLAMQPALRDTLHLKISNRT